MIIGLINLGLALEIKARGKTSEAIKRLIGLQAKTARVIRDGHDIDIPIEDVLQMILSGFALGSASLLMA